MSEPEIILDLFSCSGGASRGYARAGFRLVGSDLYPQPNYPYEFYQADAFEVLKTLIAGDSFHGYKLDDFCAIHASPPCQGFSQLSIARGDGTQHKYSNMIPETKKLLTQTGKPYIIENIERAPMDYTVKLCGSQFGQLYMWHRKFDCNFPVKQLGCDHSKTYAYPVTMPNYDRIRNEFGPKPNPEYRFHLWRGVDWTHNIKERREALPPIYTEYVGKYLREIL